MAIANIVSTETEKTERRIRTTRRTKSRESEVIAPLKNRTPEQVQEDRARILARSPKPHALPPEKTLEDIMVGQWPGEETDEEVAAALEELS